MGEGEISQMIRRNCSSKSGLPHWIYTMREPRLLAIGERRRSDSIARARSSVTEMMKRRVPNRVMRAGGTVLPVSKGRFAKVIHRTVQSRGRTGIEFNIPDAIPRGGGPITEAIEVNLADRLFSSRQAIEVIKRRLTDFVTEA